MNGLKKWIYYVGAACLALAVCNSHANPVAIVIDGNTASAEISLPAGLAVDVEIQFDSVIGLSTQNLNITADVVSITDPNLLSRIPGNVFVPAAFPVMITIEPPVAGGLSFSDSYSIELHTHNLSYVIDSPFRLMKAPVDGEFYDITEYVGAGSVRARGNSGGFSQFMIMADFRDHDSVADDKVAFMRNVIDIAVLNTTTADALNDLIDDAETAYLVDDYVTAIDAVEDFIDLIEADSGSTIPNVWRSSRDLLNVAGELVGWGNTLRFSLNAAHNLIN